MEKRFFAKDRRMPINIVTKITDFYTYYSFRSSAFMYFLASLGLHSRDPEMSLTDWDTDGMTVLRGHVKLEKKRVLLLEGEKIYKVKGEENEREENLRKTKAKPRDVNALVNINDMRYHVM